MSREIKFRVWSTDHKRFLTGYKEVIRSFFPSGDSYELQQKYEVWQQYTGLKDKNSVEIYEGDIIRLFNGELYTVEFHIEDNERNISGYLFSSFGVEIIGNIYENPELLK